MSDLEGEKEVQCFNCKEMVDDAFVIKIVGTFSPIFATLTFPNQTQEEIETNSTKYENTLCSTCSLIIAKTLSDKVRPPEERGKTYDLVVSDKVRTL